MSSYLVDLSPLSCSVIPDGQSRVVRAICTQSFEDGRRDLSS